MKRILIGLGLVSVLALSVTAHAKVEWDYYLDAGPYMAHDLDLMKGNEGVSGVAAPAAAPGFPAVAPIGNAIHGIPPIAGRSNTAGMWFTRMGMGVTTNFFDEKNTLRLQALVQHKLGLTEQRRVTPQSVAGTSNVEEGAINSGTDGLNINLNEAWFEFKEMFGWKPWAFKMGRQPLKYGDGFLVGAMYRVYDQAHEDDASIDGPGAIDAEGTGTALPFKDLTMATNFDSLRLSLDMTHILDQYAGFDFLVGHPLTLDLFASLVEENITATDDDHWFMGANLDWFWGPEKENQVSPIWTFLRHGEIGAPSGAAAAGPGFEWDEMIHTVGFYAHYWPMDFLKLSGDAGYQWGQTPTRGVSTNVMPDTQAFAAKAKAELNYEDLFTLWANYIFTGGEDQGRTGDFTEWNPMFPDVRNDFPYFVPWLEAAYRTTSTNHRRMSSSTEPGLFNMNVLGLGLASKLCKDKLDADARYFFMFTDRERGGTEGGRRDEFGSEVDAKLSWKINDNSDIFAQYALFIPGVVFQDAQDSKAHILYGGIKINGIL